MGEKLNEYPYTKLYEAFYSSDVEAFKALIHDPTDTITPETARKFINLRGLSSRNIEFINALYRAGGTIDINTLYMYIANVSTHPVWQGCMDYDGDVFQNALDHLYPRDHDVIIKLLGCGTDENNDQTMRIFRFAKQENCDFESEGYDTPGLHLRLYCRRNRIGDRINTRRTHRHFDTGGYRRGRVSIFTFGFVDVWKARYSTCIGQCRYSVECRVRPSTTGVPGQ